MFAIPSFDLVPPPHSADCQLCLRSRKVTVRLDQLVHPLADTPKISAISVTLTRLLGTKSKFKKNPCLDATNVIYLHLDNRWPGRCSTPPGPAKTFMEVLTCPRVRDPALDRGANEEIALRVSSYRPRTIDEPLWPAISHLCSAAPRRCPRRVGQRNADLACTRPGRTLGQ